MNKLCPWLESRVLRGALTPAGDGAVTLECPPEGFDYLLYDRGQDRDICLTDYACLQLTARRQRIAHLAFFVICAANKALAASLGLMGD